MMKTKFNFAMALTVAICGLSACSDDSTDDGGSAQRIDGGQYMGVEIINAQQGIQGAGAKATAFTRADDNVNPSNTEGTYADGSADEGTLSDARFYFFDAAGAGIQMNSGNFFSDLDAKHLGDETDDPLNNNQTIERHYTAVVLDPVRGVVPSQVMVVANTAGISDEELKNFSTERPELSGILATGNTGYEITSLYKEETEGGENGEPKKVTGRDNFVMSTTVYTKTNDEIEAPAATAGKIIADRSKAIENPVQIYVERVAAKVTAARGTGNWIKVTPSGDNYTKAEGTTGVDAYQLYDGTGKNDPEFVAGQGELKKYPIIAVVKGVGLADEMDKAYLFKNISARSSEKWKDNLGFEPFSISAFHRCFWETTPDQDKPNRKNHSWDDFTNGNNFPQSLNTSTTAEGAASMYTFPNTPSKDVWDGATNNVDNYWNYNTSHTRLTKLLLATQLYADKDGKGTYEPITICQFGGQNFVSEDEGKKAIASTLPLIVGIRNKENTDNIRNWRAISPDEINIVAPKDPTTEGGSDGDQYKETLSFTLKDREEDKFNSETEELVIARGSIANTSQPTIADKGDYYTNSTDGGVTEAEAFVNGENSYKPIIYNQGRSYYYTTIRHLGENKDTNGKYKLGYYGVVRNHEYRINVNTLGGFGTPVYAPKNVIVPVKPTSSNTYMAAAINVLQWRVVEQNTDMNTQDPNEKKDEKKDDTQTPTPTPPSGETNE